MHAAASREPIWRSDFRHSGPPPLLSRPSTATLHECCRATPRASPVRRTSTPCGGCRKRWPASWYGPPMCCARLRRLLAKDSGGLRQPLCQPVSRQGRRARVFSGTCPQPLGAGQCVQCKATAVHRLDAAHPARAGVRLGAVHRQGHRAGSWRSTTCPRRQSPPASGLAWYRIQPATFDAPPGRSLGCTRPSLTGTLSKSKGLMPSMQATLMPYWSGEERRWWKV